MRIPLIATNVVGSLPLSNTPKNFNRAIDDQVTAGLDYVSYPQLSSMNPMFLEPLVDDNTVRREGESFIVTQDFEPAITKEVRRWAQDARERLRKRKGFIPLKSCVTGPFTLASSFRVEGAPSKTFPAAYVDMMVEEPWLIEKLTDYVRKICRDYSATSSIVSVDEPYLSVLVGKRKNLFEMRMTSGEASDLIMEGLEGALKGIRTVPSIHACGGISRQLAEILLETSSTILSHEFSDMARNFDSYDSSDLEEQSKMLSVGVVSASPTEDPGGVEPDALIERRMDSAIQRYGPENVLFSPDCGFRPLGSLLGEEEGYHLAIRKTESLARAKKNTAKRLGLVTIEKDQEA